MDNIFINKKVWNEFSDLEMVKYQREVFDHFRSNGFPYFPTDIEWRNNELRKLKKYDFLRCLDTENHIIKQSMHGLSLAWSYHPHHYSIPCNNKRTVMELFENDDLLKGVIAKRIKIGDNMSDNGLRKMMKIFSGTQCVSNFRPTAAAAIYKQFCPENGKVFDMSSGFGGRLLGAYVAGVNYMGVEPSKLTFDGLVSMNDELGLGANLWNLGSEIKIPNIDNTVDLCFTSPPYFDCEKYSEEDTQSYIKYPSKDEWLYGFMASTMLNCRDYLKQDGLMIINIANVPSFPNLVYCVIELANTYGFSFLTDKQWNLALSKLGGAGFKSEPLLILGVIYLMPLNRTSPFLLRGI